MLMRFNFKVGDIVKSKYQARWIGVVTDRDARKNQAPLYTVRMVLNSRGEPIQKALRSQVRQLDETWLEAYEPRSQDEARLIDVWSNPEAGRSSLREQIVRLAYTRSEIRPLLLDLLNRTQ